MVDQPPITSNYRLKYTSLQTHTHKKILVCEGGFISNLDESYRTQKVHKKCNLSFQTGLYSKW